MHKRQADKQVKQNVTVRLSQRTLDRVANKLLPDERQSDFIRAAVLRELSRRERNGESNGA